MKWYSKLKWELYLTSVNSPFSELDDFADYTFENGIEIRVTRGELANTNYNNQYDLSIRKPEKEIISIGMLNKETLVKEMELLSNVNYVEREDV